jgi:hypothetical protein
MHHCRRYRRPPNYSVRRFWLAVALTIGAVAEVVRLFH